jgi:hypothetical protein
MKYGKIIITILFCILMSGCQESAQNNLNEGMINSQLIKSYNDIAIQNAIVSQHTLFPYHFVADGAELNELGQRDLAALTSHFIKYPGHLNIRRGKTNADLYEARVNMVHEKLLEAGIDTKRISISDGMPGGSGVTSERMLVILERESKGGSTSASSSSSSYSAGMK